MRKLWKHSFKNKVLITISFIMTAIFVFCASCLDSTGTPIFYIGCSISLIWYILFLIANRERLR